MLLISCSKRHRILPGYGTINVSYTGHLLPSQHPGYLSDPSLLIVSLPLLTTTLLRLQAQKPYSHTTFREPDADRRRTGRSRARRKEYLQEIEAKLRSCEQLGIEASAEIQSAARKVLEENKKLRSLLLECGMSDADIVAALGSSTDKAFDQISSTQALNRVLARRSASLESSARSSIARPSRATSMPRQLPTVPSLSIPSARPTALSSCGSLSPTSIVSSMGASPPALCRASLYTAPTARQDLDMKAEEVQYDYPFETTQNQQWAYPQAYTYASDPVGYYSTSSCVDAANIIRTMRSDPNQSYHTDQGCAPLTQPYYNDNHMLYPLTTNFSQHYSRI